MPPISRRELLALTLASVGATSATPAEPEPGNAARTLAWYDRTMRWVQLILVENDPGQYDPQWWLDLFRRSHTDGICLSAGGLVCYYPTKIPFHHRSAWMKDGDDPFGQMVEGCRKLGMTVVARTDSHSILDDAAKAHPEWLAVDSSGNKRRHWEMPETRWVTCPYGPYNFEFMTAVHREIASNYDIQGLFCNRWQGSGVCYCESCQRQYRAFSGKAVPTNPDETRPGSRYAEWTQQRLVELWRLWDGEIRRFRPQARYFSNTGLDIERAAELAPTYLAEHQFRGDRAPWAFGRGAKQFRALFGQKPIIGISGITSGARQSVTTEAELRIWLLDAIANGLRPWVMKTSAVVPDKRWVPALEKVYEWHWRNEKYMRNEANLARVAIVYGPADRGSESAGDATSGMYQALVEARIPFEMVYSRRLNAALSDRFRLLILPNVRTLSNSQCDQLRQYARRGGSVLATFETSLYDESGARRNNFGLTDLFGVDFAGRSVSNGANSYIRIERETRHPILRELEDFGQIVNAAQRVDVRAATAFARPPLTRIPSYPAIPMEEIYPRQPKTDIPEVFLRENNAGSRIVYFPGDIDRTFSLHMAADHAMLLRNAVEWAVNEAPLARITGPGMLDVACWRQKNSMTVHMVNLTNPMMLRSAYREFIPIGEQRINIRVPQGKTARGVKLLVSGQTPSVERSAGELNVTVPSILDHEVVAVDFA